MSLHPLPSCSISSIPFWGSEPIGSVRNPPFLLTWLCSLCLPLVLRWLILCIYTDCGSRPAFPVRRWYCPPILSERQTELHFSLKHCILWCFSFCYLQGIHSWGCLEPPLTGTHTSKHTHSSIWKQKASFITRKSTYPVIHVTPLPSEPETRGLLTKPRRAEKAGEHDRGCQYLLPKISLSILSPTVEMPFLTRCHQQEINSKMAAFPTKDTWGQLFSVITIIQIYRLYCLQISSTLILTTVLTCMIILIVQKNKLELREFRWFTHTTAKAHAFRCQIPSVSMTSHYVE